MSTESQVEQAGAVEEPLAESAEPIAAVAVVAEPPQSELMILLQALLRENREGTLEAIRELKRPSELEQKKIDDEAARSMSLTMRRVESAKREEEKKKTAWRSCSHTQPNGKTRFRGQGLSNGFGQGFCPECQFLSEPFQLAPHELMGGLNMGDWGGNVFLTIQQRVKNSPPPPPIPELPAGARIIF